MLVVLAIIAIFITLSTPLSNLYRQNRVSTQVQEFVTALNTARNEAVSRGASVSIACVPSHQTLDADNNQILTCANSEGTIDWNAGWIVYTDSDPSDCEISAADGDVIISRGNAMPNGFSMRVSGHECINYTASGITPSSSGLWTLCDPSHNENLRRGINLSVSGRAMILDNQRADSIDGIDLADCPSG